MSKIIVILMIFGLVVGGYYLTKPEECRAGFCKSSRCSSNAQCGRDCYCNILPTQESGYCSQ